MRTKQCHVYVDSELVVQEYVSERKAARNVKVKEGMVYRWPVKKVEQSGGLVTWTRAIAH